MRVYQLRHLGGTNEILADNSVAPCIREPDRALSFQAGSLGRIQQRQQHQRASLPVPKLEEWVTIRKRLFAPQLREVSGLPCHDKKHRLEPLKMRPTRRFETCDQVLPEIIGSTSSVGAIDLVDDATVAIQKASSQRDYKLSRHGDRTDRETLSWSEADRAEPFVESRVVELREVGDTTCLRRMTLDTILPAEQT